MPLHSPVWLAPGGTRLGGPTAGGLPGRRRWAWGDEAADVPPDCQQWGEDVFQDGPEAASLGLAHHVGRPARLLHGGGETQRGDMFTARTFQRSHIKKRASDIPWVSDDQL